MGYWKKPSDFNFTQEQIDQKVEEIWKRENESADKCCHDCGVKPGTNHLHGCDVARCENCKGKAISCGCSEDELGEDKWTGLWPGTETCYKHKLITTNDGVNWMFDYNESVELRIDTDLAKVERFVNKSTEPFDDWDWNGGELIIVVDGEVTERYSRKDLVESKVLK